MPENTNKPPLEISQPHFDVETCLKAISAFYDALYGDHDAPPPKQIYSNVQKWVSMLLSYPTPTQNEILSEIRAHPNASSEVYNLLHDLMGLASNQSTVINDKAEIVENELHLIPLILLGDAAQEHDDFLLAPSLVDDIVNTFNQHGLVVNGAAMCLPHALSIRSANAPYDVQRQALLGTLNYHKERKEGGSPFFRDNTILAPDTVEYQSLDKDSVPMLMLRCIPVSLLWEDALPDLWHDEDALKTWREHVGNLAEPHFNCVQVLEPLQYNDALVNGARMFNMVVLNAAISQAKAKVGNLSFSLSDPGCGDVAVTLHDRATMAAVSEFTLSYLPQRACSAADIDDYVSILEGTGLKRLVCQVAKTDA